MMDFETWKNMILDVATQVSDREFQRSAWFGKGEHVSSPDELYNGLFDDSMFEKFLETHGGWPTFLPLLFLFLTTPWVPHSFLSRRALFAAAKERVG
jgi:hypothetical protein